jgi:hypothetical protein
MKTRARRKALDQAPDLTKACKCDNCNWRGPQAYLGKQLDETPDLNDRLDPGGEVPAGECPKCGCFAYFVAGTYIGVVK